MSFAPLYSLHELAAPKIETLPADIAASVRAEFYKRIDAIGLDGKSMWDEKRSAHDWIAQEVEELRRCKLSIAFDEQSIDEESKKWAAICRSLLTYETAVPYVKGLGVTVPEIKGTVTAKGIAKRFACHRWWRRQLRKLFTRSAETKLRELGHVQKRKQLYASDRAVSYRKQRKQRDNAMMKEMIAVSDAGDQLNLFDIVEKSLANPALRRAELMTRMSGFEELSKWAEHKAIFVTLTCPSAFHRTHASGEQNERWLNFSVRDGQAWLCKMWSRVRAKLKRASSSVYGFRVSEPHHDGTPHWHAVFFGCRRALVLIRRYMSQAWRSEYSAEPGMWRHRVTFKKIHSERGSATGYISKYVAKNIDGFSVGGDYEANDNQDAQQTCDRVAAWASAHGIRQFQQIGGPTVGLWRELRRLRDVVAVEKIEAARKAADEGEWARFVVAVGGIAVGRNTQLTLWKEQHDSDGVIRENQYGEVRAAQVVGVESSNDRICTRDKVWRIERGINSGSGLSFESEKLLRKPTVIGLPLQSKTTHGIDELDMSIRVATSNRHIKKMGKAWWDSLEPYRRPRSRSRSSSSLGPVSITVRSSKWQYSAKSRGDPL